MSTASTLVTGTRPGSPYGTASKGSLANKNGSLNLFTFGALGPYGTMPLSMVGANLYGAGSLNLFLCNKQTPGSLNLYISGTGSEPGAIPLSGTMPLYMECPTRNVMNLYLLGGPQSSSNGAMNLYAFGAFNSTGSMNLAMPNTKDSISGHMILYCHGF